MEIKPCPNPQCRSECKIEWLTRGRRFIECTQDLACGYCGPIAANEEEAICLHNLICTPQVTTGDAEAWELHHVMIQFLAELVRLVPPEGLKLKLHQSLIDREQVVAIVMKMKDALDKWGDQARKHLPTVQAEPVATSGVIPDYRGFALALFEATDWPEGGDLDGFDFQECAERHGLLIPTRMEKPCSEDNCSCADNGADFPATCLRKNLAPVHPPVGREGWVMVPSGKPKFSISMMEAAMRVPLQFDRRLLPTEVVAVYKAMIAAAPAADRGEKS